MDIQTVLDQIMKTLNDLPDERGLARCAAFYSMYKSLELLSQLIQKKDEDEKNERLILEAKIQDLEEQCKEKE